MKTDRYNNMEKTFWKNVFNINLVGLLEVRSQDKIYYLKTKI